MQTYTARFSDGVAKTRRSERAYTHAWKYAGSEHVGFAASFFLADKAARNASGDSDKRYEIISVEKS